MRKVEEEVENQTSSMRGMALLIRTVVNAKEQYDERKMD